MPWWCQECWCLPISLLLATNPTRPTRRPLPLPRPSPLLPPPPAGQVILQQDHVLHTVVFISRGFVDVSVYGQLLETLGPDDHLAELALLPVPATLGDEVRRALAAWLNPLGCMGGMSA